MAVRFIKEIVVSADTGSMDTKLRNRLETLKKMGKDQKKAREPLVTELANHVFNDMVNELQLDGVLIDIYSRPAP